MLMKIPSRSTLPIPNPTPELSAMEKAKLLDDTRQHGEPITFSQVVGLVQPIFRMLQVEILFLFLFYFYQFFFY